MPGAGNDPFSGTSVQNVLQHTISPKVVPDGSGGYTVKNDLINVDNIYITGTLAANSSEIRVGNDAGKTGQKNNAIAVGSLAGTTNQGLTAIAIGQSAGYTLQGARSIAIGGSAGSTDQGTNAIAIGYKAGSFSQTANSIVINATGVPLQSAISGSFVVKPIRGDTSSNLSSGGFKSLFYNSTTGEICYSTS